MRIYVTNLRAGVTDEDLKAHFEVVGEVSSATIVKTRTTNEPSGFGFVDMVDKSAALEAFKSLDGKLLKGNPLKLYDRREALERRISAERRNELERRISTDRRIDSRRKATGEEEIVSLFVELNRRVQPDRRDDDHRRNLVERRGGKKRRVDKARRFPNAT